MTTEKNKLGFGGQWIDGTPVGEHTDSDGDLVKIDTAFLEAVVRNFEKTKSVHSVPLVPMVIDHPELNGPAFGWVDELRVNNGCLERKFSDVNSQFEDAVKAKAFRKRSDAFYLNPKDAPLGLVPALRHVGFLGAKIPAIKGIADIQFSEDEGKTVDVEVDTAITFSEGDTETMKDEDVKKTIRESVAEFFEPLKKMFSGEKTADGSLSEADTQQLIEAAMKKAEASFTEKLTALETKNTDLQRQIDTQTDGSKRAQAEKLFAGFAEKGILPPALKERVTNLMEALAGIPDKRVTVIEFSEEGGKPVEKKTEHTLLAEFCEFVKALPPYIRFGEKFGDVELSGDGSDVVDPKRMDAMRDEVGIKKPDAKAA